MDLDYASELFPLMSPKNLKYRFQKRPQTSINKGVF